MGLIWVGKSTFAEMFPAFVVAFPGGFTAAGAAEEFAVGGNLVELDSGTPEFEAALGPAFVWPHPYSPSVETNAKTKTAVRMSECYS